jgi:hypothetical protein
MVETFCAPPNEVNDPAKNNYGPLLAQRKPALRTAGILFRFFGENLYKFNLAMRFKTAVLEPLILFVLSTSLVFAAAAYSKQYFVPGSCTGHHFGYSTWFSNWDGQWYNLIVNDGYKYSDAEGYSPIVFFPLYPLLGRVVQIVLRLRSEYSLLLVSSTALAAFCCVWMSYVRSHPKNVSTAKPVALTSLTLVLFWPNALYFHLNYTESLYILLLGIFFRGMAKRWSLASLVVVCGLLTATRPTGIICCAVLVLHSWIRLRHGSSYKRCLLTAAIGLLSAWGLCAYMLFLHWEFGNPLLFATKQAAWNGGSTENLFFLHWRETLAFRPVWGFLVDGSLAEIHTYAWNVMNRGFWLLAWLALGTGAFRRWLTSEEILFCVLSLLFFYYAKSAYNMESVGRYLLSLLPLFVVLGRLLTKLPVALQTGIFAILGMFLFLHTGLYRMMYCVF